jgi:hypothetical protein
MSDSTKTLIIPDRIKVGFQQRVGTYTGKLAYVIYFDHKGVLRKEKSWERWRDHKLTPVEFDNVPIEGFVLNKGVGGARHSYGWNARNEYIRVYDPRDFEFEISVANLLFILREGDCSRGKGLEGKFIYSWDGTELVLLPEASVDFQHSKKYTDLQKCSVESKDLIPGASYLSKQQQVLIYLGKFDWYCLVSPDKWRFPKKYMRGCVKRHIFAHKNEFVVMDDLKQIATINSDAVVANYAELVDSYRMSANGTKPVSLYIEERPASEDEEVYGRYNFFIQEDDGYIECRPAYHYGQTYQDRPEYITLIQKYTLNENVLYVYRYNRTCYNKQPAYGYGYGSHRQDSYPWVEPNCYRLFVQLESGAIFQINGETLTPEKNHAEKN